MTFFSESLITQYSSIANRLASEAFINARSGKLATARDRHLLRVAPRGWLPAVNHRSRLVWGKAIADQLSAYFCPTDGVSHERKVYLVTLCDVRWVTAVSDENPDIDKFKANLRTGLRGYSYLCNMDAAYYSNVQNGAVVKDKRCIFWHMHGLLWGISESECRRLVFKLEQSGRYTAIAEGLPGVDAREIQPGELAPTTGYIFKPPATAYRLSRLEASHDDQTRTKFIQGQSGLRPGERLRLFHAMKRLSLDELALAGGEGVPLLAEARGSALVEVS